MPAQIFGMKALKQTGAHAVQMQAEAEQQLGKKSPYTFQYYLSFLVIVRILTEAGPRKSIHNWISRYLIPPDEEPSDAVPYFRSGDDYEALILYVSRVIELAELLFNLQRVPTIQTVYRRIVDDLSGCEETILELEGLRLIALTQLPFRFVHTGAGLGLHYECEVYLLNGTTVHLEMKCKVETAEFSESNVKNTLDHARKKQLPPNKCGAILLKIPRHWRDNIETRTALDRVIENAMRNSTRISAVIYYVRALFAEEPQAIATLAIKEVLNPNSPYYKELEGGIFQNRLDNAPKSFWLPFGSLTPELLTKFDDN